MHEDSLRRDRKLVSRVADEKCWDRSRNVARHHGRLEMDHWIVIESAPLSPEEEADLAPKARSGDRDARNRMLFSVYRMILQYVLKSRAHDKEDLVQFLIERVLHVAGNVFDPARGIRWSTFAGATIRLYARNYFSERCNRSLCEGVPIGDGVEFVAAPSAEAQDDDKSDARYLVRTAMGKLDPRLRAIVSDRMQGRTLEVLAREYHITKERVRQLECRARHTMKREIQRMRPQLGPLAWED